MKTAMHQLQLRVGAYLQVLKLIRMIDDLSASVEITQVHLEESLLDQLRWIYDRYAGCEEFLCVLKLRKMDLGVGVFDQLCLWVWFFK